MVKLIVCVDYSFHAKTNCVRLQPMIKMRHNSRNYKKYDVGMKVMREFPRIADGENTRAGNFDVHHLGAKAMLTQLITQANKDGYRFVILLGRNLQNTLTGNERH